MKNFVKEGQKLPLFGIGPYMVSSFFIITLIGIILFRFVFKIGTVSGIWSLIFRIFAVLYCALGISLLYIGALRSEMDKHITENILKTDGIYSWVRNPMYSGCWHIIFGFSLFWVNYFLIPIFFINWLIMTIVLINTEEKWLANLYGDEYLEYKKRVNRCIPIKRFWRK